MSRTAGRSTNRGEVCYRQGPREIGAPILTVLVWWCYIWDGAPVKPVLALGRALMIDWLAASSGRLRDKVADIIVPTKCADVSGCRVRYNRNHVYSVVVPHR